MSLQNTQLITGPRALSFMKVTDIIQTNKSSISNRRLFPDTDKAYKLPQADLPGESASKKVKKDSITVEIQATTQNFKEFYTKITSQPNIQSEIKSQYDRIQEDITFKKLAIHFPSALSENFDKLCQKVQSSGATQKKNWNEDEISFLISIMTYHTYMTREDHKKLDDTNWKYLASIFPGRSVDQLQHKWHNLLKFYLSKDPWRTDEDQLLRAIVMSRKDGTDWKGIANELNMQNPSKIFRSSKQCRERWNNHIDPDVNRGPWTTEEDLRLLNLIVENGKKWSLLAKEIGNRTENSVKNRWYSLMRRVGVGENNTEMTEGEEKEKINKLYTILANEPKGESNSLSNGSRRNANELDDLSSKTKKLESKSRSLGKISENAPKSTRKSAFEKSSTFAKVEEEELPVREKLPSTDIKSLAEKIRTMSKEKLEEAQGSLVTTTTPNTVELDTLAERQILNNLSYIPASKSAFVTIIPATNFSTAASLPSSAIQINGAQLETNATQMPRIQLVSSAGMNPELQSRLFRFALGANDIGSLSLLNPDILTVQANSLANLSALNSNIISSQQTQKQQNLQPDSGQNSFEVKTEALNENLSQKEKLKHLLGKLETALQKQETVSLQNSSILPTESGNNKHHSLIFEPFKTSIFSEISSQSQKYQFSLFSKEDNSVLLLDPLTSGNMHFVNEISKFTNPGL